MQLDSFKFVVHVNKFVWVEVGFKIRIVKIKQHIQPLRS